MNKYSLAESDSKSTFPRTNNFLFTDKRKPSEIKISAIQDIKKVGSDISKTIYPNKNQDSYYGKRLSLCDIICFSFNCRRENEKYKIFSLIIQEIEKSLEVSKKIKLYKEFGLLSAYILNKNELTAFNNQNYSLIKISHENEKLNKIQLDQMVEHYKEKYILKMLNEKDQMLVNNLKKNIQSKIIHF